MKININDLELYFFQLFYNFWNEIKEGITD